jgi:hypothetical protein
MMFPWMIEATVASLADRYPVLTITGPRQSRKTTLPAHKLEQGTTEGLPRHLTNVGWNAVPATGS